MKSGDQVSEAQNATHDIGVLRISKMPDGYRRLRRGDQEQISFPRVRTNRPHSGCRAIPRNRPDVRVRSAKYLELLCFGKRAKGNHATSTSCKAIDYDVVSLRIFMLR
jgi:hypothetical protein